MPESTLIVGGGISGLATAVFLRRALGPAADITVLEATDHIGGKIRTTEVMGLPVDVGPDAFLSRSTDLRRLIDEVGLTGQITEPASGSYIWTRGRLRPIPPGAAFGLPDRLVPLLRSGLLSPAGVVRAGGDIVLPHAAAADDPSVADLVRPRFGDDVYHRMIEPLLGGVHAGDPAHLSAKSTVPEIYALARKNRSLYLALRKQRAAMPTTAGKRPAPLVSITGGLGRLRDALVETIGPDHVHAQTAVTGIRREKDGWLVSTDRGECRARDVVLATPAHSTADLLAPLDTSLAQTLAGIPYVSVANATLAFPRPDIPDLPPGTGFLVPPIEGRFVVGCTWLTNKWPHLANDDMVLVKCMVGRAGDQRWLTMTDDQIVAGIRNDLALMLGITHDPLTSMVQRWPDAMPQYVVGHAARLQQIDERLAGLPGLHLTGAAYRGAGLAGCVTQAAGTARDIMEGVTA